VYPQQASSLGIFVKPDCTGSRNSILCSLECAEELAAHSSVKKLPLEIWDYVRAVQAQVRISSPSESAPAWATFLRMAELPLPLQQSEFKGDQSCWLRCCDN